MRSAIAPSKSKAKDTRLFARVSSADKRLIEKAAALKGQSVGAFVITQARNAASELIEEHSLIKLNREESRRFVKALLAPPRPPTEAMKRALKVYRETVISDVNPESEKVRQRRRSK
jgi:uncharacterized protein (DUF1778 family)